MRIAPPALRFQITRSAGGEPAVHETAVWPVRLGRYEVNDVRLADRRVSGVHAQVDWQDGTLVLTDLGAKNGTFVGDEDERIPAGASVDLAPYGYAFRIEAFRIAIEPLSGAAAPKPRVRSGVLRGRQTARESAFLGGENVGVGAPTPSTIPASSASPPINASTSPLGALALAGLEDLARLYVPGERTLSTEDDVVGLLHKIQDAIDVVARGYIPVRDAFRQVRTTFGVDDVARPSESPSARIAILRQSSSAKEVAGVLLDWHEVDPEIAREIEATFTGLSMHELGFLAGLMRGLRELFDALSPDALEAACADSIERRERGFERPGWGPFRYRALWDAFVRTHADFADEQSASFAALFGRNFQLAYRTSLAESVVSKHTRFDRVRPPKPGASKGPKATVRMGAANAAAAQQTKPLFKTGQNSP